MNIYEWAESAGRKYPARRNTRNIVGGVSSIQTEEYCMGYVELDPQGGQVPWHNHPQAETYTILSGHGQMCIGNECEEVSEGQTVYIPADSFHQLTNVGDDILRMIYCYGPAGDVDHWKQELSGTLPKAGIDVPPLPEGAWPQHTDPPES